jgi:tRNA (guanine-N7-)-methyltransferase
MDAEPKSILYGRRRGRRLRPGRQRLLRELLPRIAVDPAHAEGSPRGWFDRPVAGVWLEVGFGGGEHLFAQAAAHPEIGFLGCEPYLNGVANLLARIDAVRDTSPPDNIRILADDARSLLARLPAGSIDRVFLLFPDPWPKTRHHRRRFVASAQLDELARIMAPGGELRIATDHMGYLRWILSHCLRHGSFDWLARGPSDWRDRPADWPETRYEAKARAGGATSVYLRFHRRPKQN